jgi:uncharacterized Fe-S radical SAM superfamily protein PflX
MSSIVDKFKTKVTDRLIAPKEISSNRLNICENCEHLIKITRQCSKCFCVVDAKARLRSSTCPEGKW